MDKIDVKHSFDGHPLLSNGHTISFTPDKFILDFKSSIPQFVDAHKPVLLVNHKAIIMEPYIMKDFVKRLQDNIKKFEERNGTIVPPEFFKEQQKINKKTSSKNSKTFLSAGKGESVKNNSYFG